jgi:hypothetical protein
MIPLVLTRIVRCTMRFSARPYEISVFVRIPTEGYPTLLTLANIVRYPVECSSRVMFFSQLTAFKFFGVEFQAFAMIPTSGAF